jgi:hypothetical protein
MTRYVVGELSFSTIEQGAVVVLVVIIVVVAVVHHS